jgi:hypothetical protein
MCVLTPCGHAFHYTCLAEWYQVAVTDPPICPTCNGVVVNYFNRAVYSPLCAVCQLPLSAGLVVALNPCKCLLLLDCLAEVDPDACPECGGNLDGDCGPVHFS